LRLADAGQLVDYRPNPAELTVVSIMRLAQTTHGADPHSRGHPQASIRVRAVIMGENPRRADMESALH